IPTKRRRRAWRDLYLGERWDVQVPRLRRCAPPLGMTSPPFTFHVSPGAASPRPAVDTAGWLFPLTPEGTVSPGSIHPDIARYHDGLAPADRAICELLAAELTRH